MWKNIFFRFLVLSVCFLFLSCAQKSAFSRFDMDKVQELSSISLQNSKIKSLDGDIKGLISVIYLNDVYPKKYVDFEYFYVYLYLNDRIKLENLDSVFKLNNTTAISVEKLSNQNQFSKLAAVHNEWTQYYLVKFNQDKRSKIEFKMDGKDLLSNSMFYYKDEE